MFALLILQVHFPYLADENVDDDCEVKARVAPPPKPSPSPVAHSLPSAVVGTQMTGIGSPILSADRYRGSIPGGLEDERGSAEDRNAHLPSEGATNVREVGAKQSVHGDTTDYATISKCGQRYRGARTRRQRANHTRQAVHTRLIAIRLASRLSLERAALGMQVKIWVKEMAAGGPGGEGPAGGEGGAPGAAAAAGAGAGAAKKVSSSAADKEREMAAARAAARAKEEDGPTRTIELTEKCGPPPTEFLRASPAGRGRQ